MKITIEEIKNIEETEIIIKCKEKDESVENIISTLRLFDKNVIAKKDGAKFILSPNDIYYFDSVDDKVFCYTHDDVYETNYRLYEVEEIFKNTTFLRINKNMIINVNMINSFKSTLNGRMEAILNNDDKIEISRNYVPSLKLVLGGRK